MTRKDLATRAIAESQILKDLTVAHKVTRSELEREFSDPGEREVGKLGDTSIGTAALQDGREYWTVDDEPAFLAWVLLFRPDELVQQVRTSYRDAVLAECKRSGGLIDPATGEVTMPPGVTCRKGAPILVLRPDPHASALITRELLGDAAERLGLEAS